MDLLLFLEIVLFLYDLIGNGTSCSPIKSVIILVITGMITDRIELHSILLTLLRIFFPIKQTCNKRVVVTLPLSLLHK